MQRVDDIKYDGLEELGSTKIIALDFGVDGIYGHTGTAYVSIPLQTMIPILADMDNYSSVEGKIVLDYETEGAATMDAELFNYTDLLSIAGSEFSLPNQTWGHGSSGWFDLAAALGKAVRVRTKRVGGTGGNNVKVEGMVLLVKFKK